MTLQNLSGRVKTKGSDLDIIAWLEPLAWSIARALFAHKIDDGQIPFSFSVFGLDIDLYLTPKQAPPRRAMCVLLSYYIQQAWSEETLAQYTADKEEISHLTGKARKLAKIGLAQVYGLPTYHYYASMSS